MENIAKTIKMRKINENEIEVDIPTTPLILKLILVIIAIAGGITLIIDILLQIL